jgi:Flp pilus assembly protein TadD
MFNSISHQRLKLMISLFLILAIVMIYGQVGSFGFVDWDDGSYVTKNLYVQKGLSEEGFIYAFSTSHGGSWHPVTWLSHMLDSELYGLNPAGHHYTNIIFHIANSLFLFFILFRMTGALWRSAFVAALFAVHPLHVESVAWVSERKDVLSTFFGLLMIGSYYRYTKTPDLKNYLLVIIFLSMGLMSKSMLVSFPFVLLLVDFWPLKRIQLKNNSGLRLEDPARYGFKGIYQLVVEKIPLFVIAFIICVLTFFIQRSDGVMASLEVLPLKTRISNAIISYVSYIFKAIWPHNLSYYYPYSIGTFPAWYIYGAAFLILSVLLWSIYLSKQYPYVIVGLFWYFVTLVPVIGLVQVSDQAMADRYTYIPLIGLFIVIAWGVPDILKEWNYRKIFLCVSAVIILSSLTISSFVQTKHWKNSIALFENAVKINENNSHALSNLITALIKNGKYDNAFFYLSRAVKRDPQKTYLRMNLATVLFLQAKPDEAISQYRKILQTETKNADVYYNLAYVLSTKGKFDEAVSLYNEALRIDPKYAKAHYYLGDIKLEQGKLKEAFSHFAKAIKIKSDYVQSYNKLGVILLKQGKLDKAKVFFSKALQLDPNFSEARNNLNILLNSRMRNIGLEVNS